MDGNRRRRKISCSASFPSDVLAIAAGPEIAILPVLLASFKAVSAPSKIGTATGRRERETCKLLKRLKW